MSEHATESGTERTNLSWDFGVGLLSIVADDPEPGNAASQVEVNFRSAVWIWLDRGGRPVSVDVFDVPAIITPIVPAAPRGLTRGEDSERSLPAPGAIPWLLDTDSDWLWVELIRAPSCRRLERSASVSLRLAGEKPTHLKLRIPVVGG